MEVNAAFSMQDEIDDSRIIKAPALRSFPCHVGVGTDAVAPVRRIDRGDCGVITRRKVHIKILT